MTALQIALAAYVFVALADVLDSRGRCRLGWGRALLWAPFWPLTLTSRILGRIR